MRNPINHNKLLLQISLFLGIVRLAGELYLCRKYLKTYANQ